MTCFLLGACVLVVLSTNNVGMQVKQICEAGRGSFFDLHTIMWNHYLLGNAVKQNGRQR